MWFAKQRYYISSWGRFATADPYRGSAKGGVPQSWNRYGYALGDPVNKIDPNGLEVVCQPIRVGGEHAVINGDVCEETVPFVAGVIEDGQGNVVHPEEVPAGPGPSGFGDVSANPQFTYNLPGAPTMQIGGSGGGAPIDGTKQTFSQCMTAHANDFSIPGALNGAYNAITGSDNLAFQNNFLAQAILGNPITTFLYGSATDNAGTAASLAPTIVQMGMGTVTSYGRRTTTIMALNLAGKGGVPLALGAASAGTRAVIGRLASAAGGFMSLGVSLAVNGGFAAAEAAYCASQP